MSTNEEVVVVARWQVAPASFDDVLAAATELRLASLTEPGCLGYELFQPVAGSGELLLLERYRDAAAVQAHRDTPHFKALALGRIIPQLTRREVELLRVREPL